MKNENSCSIKSIRSDHGVGFKMIDSIGFVKSMESHIAFQPLGLPNKMVWWRKNRSLEEITRTMLNEFSLPKYFWADVVYTASYVLNRTFRPILKKTPYKLYNCRKPNIIHLRVFGYKFFVLNNGKDNL